MTKPYPAAVGKQHRGQLQVVGPFIILLHCLLPWVMAAEQATRDYRVEQPTEPVTLIELRLDRGLHLGQFRSKGLQDGDLAPVMLHLYCRGSTITSAWAMAEALGGRGKVGNRGVNKVLSMPLSLDAKNVTCDDDSLSGKIIRLDVINARAWEAEQWTIQASVSGTSVTGTFTCKRPEDVKRRTDGVSYAGKVTGRILTQDEWQAQAAGNRLKAGADWPCWLGPTSNGRAVPYDGELVASWEDARLAWRAEVDLVPGSPGQGHPNGGTRHDYNGPVVADGKVYLFVMEPAIDGPIRNGWGGEDFRSKIEKQNRGKQQARWILASLVNDVGYCFDAATGALLWRTVFPHRGASGNFVGKGKGGHWSTPVISDGRVYWCGSNSRVYCVDGNTGDRLWEQVLVPGVVESFDRSVKQFIDENRDQGLPYNGKLCNHLQASPCLAGGVLVCPAKDQLGGRKDSGSGLYGLDPATGKVLWGPIPALKSYASPLRWHHDGKDFILTPGVNCIDPKTGKELWSWKGMTGSVFCGAVFGDYYLPRATGKRRKDGGRDLQSSGPILRLAATGATVASTIPVSLSGSGSAPGVGATCDDDGNFFYYQDPGSNDSPDKALNQLVAESGVYVCDHIGQLVAKCTAKKFKHAHGYGSLIYSNRRIIIPGSASSIKMMTWDIESKQLEDAEGLRINYYWCSTPSMADGRLFFRTNDGVVCYDLRKPK